jgi:hypothetical protein
MKNSTGDGLILFSSGPSIELKKTKNAFDKSDLEAIENLTGIKTWTYKEVSNFDIIVACSNSKDATQKTRGCILLDISLQNLRSGLRKFVLYPYVGIAYDGKECSHCPQSNVLKMIEDLDVCEKEFLMKNIDKFYNIKQ